MTRKFFATAALAALTAGTALTLALGGSGAGAATAATVSANTHSANHADTTSVTGSATVASPNGPVWAYDNLTVKLTATATGVDTYTVHLTVTGSFAGFADPRTAAEGSSDPGGPLVSSGSVKGTYDLTVTSATAPNATYLAAQQDSATGLGSMVRQLFGGSADVAGGHYAFYYTKVGGAVYSQIG